MNRMRMPSRLTGRELLPVAALGSVLLAVLVVILSSGSSGGRTVITTVRATTTATPTPSVPAATTVTVTTAKPKTQQSATPTTSPSRSKSPAQTPPPGTAILPPAQALGQLIIAPLNLPGSVPSQLLADVRAGHIGGLIIFGNNLEPSSVKAAADELQQAARAAGHPGLLIMTDQEGTGVERVAGPPYTTAAQMSDPERVGAETGALLRSAGVNVDLAPVADVVRNPSGFIAQYGRSFGADPGAVASRACDFAQGLARERVAYTLKHFPGLGDAGATSTDTAPVTISLTRQQLEADTAAYRRCGSGSYALVMVSSATYPALDPNLPAVMSSASYQFLREQGVTAPMISDALSSGALSHEASPGLHSLQAGLDLLLYSSYESVAANSYATLASELQRGVLSRSQVEDAANTVIQLKSLLGLLR